MAPENDTKPNLAKYYSVRADLDNGEFPEITTKNVSFALFVLGLIAIMVNLLMVYVYMRQEWVIIWPQTSGVWIGTGLMLLGGVLYFIDRYFEKKSS